MGGAHPGRAKRAFLTGLALFGLCLFAALGIWQVERLAWKRALIASVEARVTRPPVPAPPPAQWGAINAAADQYRRVTATGRFLNGSETLVQALTERGAGFWVLTPLRTGSGAIILINRGFVPAKLADLRTRLAAPPAGEVRITGLLRISEPGGTLLRANRPAEGRFYTRDVTAIAQVRGLGPVAPFFIDADATPNPGGWPQGGLTVIRFPNNHLLYALTWFGLALVCGWALVTLWRDRA